MLITPDTASPAAVQAVLSMAALTAIFAVKHVTADFLLQTNGMAQGKERRAGWLMPLLSHVACHGALTLLIALVVEPRLWWLAIVDLVLHLCIDRSKTLIGQSCGWRPEQACYWWLLGLDQCGHQLTNIGLATALLLW